MSTVTNNAMPTSVKAYIPHKSYITSYKNLNFTSYFQEKKSFFTD